MMISFCVKCLNELISLFELTTLPLELYLHKHMWANSGSENQNAVDFQTPLFEKEG
jgi:hypothetical protein